MERNNEWWKRNVEGNALIIAERVIEQSGIVVTGVNKEMTKELEDACEQYLLEHYKIKMLRFEGHDDIRAFIWNFYSDAVQEFIKSEIQNRIPEIKKEDEMLRKKQ